MINIGIIGCGKITQVRHAPEYYMNPNAKIIGFYDTNKERAEQLAKEYNAVAYSSYEKMLENIEIDAVSVCSANQFHAEMTIAALKAGKHVLCEKPMAMSLAECEAMVQAAKESGKLLMIGHNQRLLKTHKRAKKLILEGAIGDIVTFKTTFAHGGPETWSIEPGKGVWFFSKEKAVLGAMADLGIHKTDLILYLTGQQIVETTAYLGTIDKKDANGNLIEVDDNAICIYKLSGGAVGTMSASW
ncbi:MAG: dehydrogenase, partial [Clostridiales bacterium]|nr:dehydrogenase [Clostridiales bacterium]